MKPLAVIAVGVDIVGVDRFAALVTNRPAVVERLFTQDEVVRPDGADLPVTSLAARFAVKEAVAKCLGAPAGLEWHDCQILSLESGEPYINVTGTVLARAHELGITSWRVSMSHDNGSAIAYVTAGVES